MDQLLPSQIRFKQDSIKSRFQNGSSVNAAALDLCNGVLHPDDFPTIQVCYYDSKIYSFDNRRLYIFRVAQYRGRIKHIKVRFVSESRFDLTTFTTKNKGRKIVVRNDTTLPHCKPEWLQEYISPIRSPPLASSDTPGSWAVLDPPTVHRSIGYTTPRRPAVPSTRSSSSFAPQGNRSQRNRSQRDDGRWCVIL